MDKNYSQILCFSHDFSSFIMHIMGNLLQKMNLYVEIYKTINDNLMKEFAIYQMIFANINRHDIVNLKDFCPNYPHLLGKGAIISIVALLKQQYNKQIVIQDNIIIWNDFYKNNNDIIDINNIHNDMEFKNIIYLLICYTCNVFEFQHGQKDNNLFFIINKCIVKI